MDELIDRYTYRVYWSDEDEEYVGLCAEFGLLSHLDDTPERALTGIRELVSHADKNSLMNVAHLGVSESSCLSGCSHISAET